MIEQPFTLIPYPAPHIPAIDITGKVTLQNNILALRYSLTGNVEDVLFPPPSLKPNRKDELWKSTCFEFFLAIQEQPAYWEFNMSPSGDWNVYRMDAYRRIGFREETAVSQLPFEFRTESDGYLLDVSLDLTPMIRSEQGWEMAVTAIIQTTNGKETYWALKHPASQPDFHLREGFTLSPAGQTHPAPGSAAGD